MEHFRDDRTFRLEFYSTSFSSLMLLSTAHRTKRSRTGVGFLLVSALKLPTFLSSLCIRDPHDHESALEREANALSALRIAEEPKLFVLDAGGTVGWVLAGQMIAWENAKLDESVRVTDLLDRFAQGPPFAAVVPDRR